MAKITDISENDRPRERFARLGGEAVSDSELLAIFFRTGAQGENAIEVGRNLLKKYGSLSELGGLSVEELAEEFALGPAKATMLLAAFELGNRCAQEKMMREPMDSPEAIYQAMSPRLSNQRIEHVWLILLDSKLRALSCVELSTGLSNSSACDPQDVFHKVLTARTQSFVLVHNHPSGDPRPSTADRQITKLIQEGCELLRLRLVDHIIIGRPSDSWELPYFSFANEGQL